MAHASTLSNVSFVSFPLDMEIEVYDVENYTTGEP